MYISKFESFCLLAKKHGISHEHWSKEIQQNKIIFAELEKFLKASKKKGRRCKLELYYDILYLINDLDGKIKPTHIQLAIKTSYDKFTKYLDELERGNLIQREPLVITEKGKNFLVDYEKLMHHLPEKK